MDQIRSLKKLIIAAGFLFAAVFYLRSEETKQDSGPVALETASAPAERKKNDAAFDSGAAQETGWNTEELAEKLAGQLAPLLPGCSCGHLTAQDAAPSVGAGETFAPADVQPVSPAGEIPAPALPTAAPSPAVPSQAAPGLVNLNTATKEELMTLPGIGGAKADAIIRYRTEAGAFVHIEEVMNISGIKEAAFEKIKDLIGV